MTPTIINVKDFVYGVPTGPLPRITGFSVVAQSDSYMHAIRDATGEDYVIQFLSDRWRMILIRGRIGGRSVELDWMKTIDALKPGHYILFCEACGNVGFDAEDGHGCVWSAPTDFHQEKIEQTGIDLTRIHHCPTCLDRAQLDEELPRE